MSGHTPTPWFVSGSRYKMNGGEWHNINRYDEAKKQDENIACVGYDPRTGLGMADAHFIVLAVNSHDALVKALEHALEALAWHDGLNFEQDGQTADGRIRAALLLAKGSGQP